MTYEKLKMANDLKEKIISCENAIERAEQFCYIYVSEYSHSNQHIEISPHLTQDIKRFLCEKLKEYKEEFNNL